ncbi:winged helix-turn-helix transcriptional regulator [Mycolicibacterium komossense]|uniref:Helix-turn-helix transcriptional regulator n=1 Tax=Mycolicibacterium komossense TaxID=1779 RepID=A0ABT3C5R3_9MYCO|nr:helix-turn-helix domain-containing protein [Mycolicibacterium komossense]MCV7224817.1 helix-turn-helix transcriptional regulator [Mycolicibacterium komossense]
MSTRLARSTCPVSRAVDVVGDKWTLMILRDAFEGVTRFTQFQRSLGVARNILAGRLHQLVDAGVLALQPHSDGSAYNEYVLTPKGAELFHLVVALREWGADHAFGDEEPRTTFVDTHTGGSLPRLRYETPDGDEVRPEHTRPVRPEGWISP